MIDFESILTNIHEKKPMVHHITNYVTVNDCANAVLAIGGSPVMADEPEEVEEMVSFASALVINIGTVNRQKAKSMMIAGTRAKELGIPVIFDPTGCGATKFRKEVSGDILQFIRPSIIKGNTAEILSLLNENVKEHGVDSRVIVSDDDLAKAAKQLAGAEETLVFVSGKTDIISDGTRTARIYNGKPEMEKVTGTGCMLSSITGTIAGANMDNLFDAAVTAALMMGIAGEMAYEKEWNRGPGHFHMGILDALGTITAEDLRKRGKYSIDD